MLLVWIFAFVLGLTGVALAAMGLRGRRINDHPLCRKCRFDLVGLFDPEQQTGGARCPECGQAMGTNKDVRIGARRRRRGALALGSAFLLLSLSIVGVLSWGTVNAFNWNTIKPTWLLVYETRSADKATAQPALAELVRRTAKGSLSHETHRGLVERALEIQQDDLATWLPEWGDLVEIAAGQGWLADSDLLQFAEHSINISLQIRSPVMFGAESSMSVRGWAARPGTGKHHNIQIIVDIQDARLDDARMDDIHGLVGFTPGPGLGSGSFRNKLLTDSSGAHRVQATFRMYVRPLASGSSSRGGVWASSGPYIASETDLGPLTFQRSAVFTVLPPGQSDVTLTKAPELTDEIRRSVHIQQARLTHEAEGDKVSVSLMIDKPPVNVAFRVWLRSGDKEIPIGYAWGVPGSSYGTGGEHSIESVDAEHAQLVLRADAEAARRSGFLHQAWDGEIVIKHINFQIVDER